MFDTLAFAWSITSPISVVIALMCCILIAFILPEVMAENGYIVPKSLKFVGIPIASFLISFATVLMLSYLFYSGHYLRQPLARYTQQLLVQLPKLQDGRIECTAEGLAISGRYQTTFKINSDAIRTTVPVTVKYPDETRCLKDWYFNRITVINFDLAINADKYVSDNITKFEEAVRPYKEIEVSSLAGATIKVPVTAASMPEKTKDVKGIDVTTSSGNQKKTAVPVNTVISAQ